MTTPAQSPAPPPERAEPLPAHGASIRSRADELASTPLHPTGPKTYRRAANNRILIVDDNPAIHGDFRKVLNGRKEGQGALENAEAFLFDEAPVAPAHDFELQSAHQGQEALTLVKQAVGAQKPFAVAFVDVRMPPGWDGIETVARLWEVCPELQVVICTAYSDYSWEDMIPQLGCPDNLVILKKPFDSVEVLQLAHALSHKWELNRQAQLKLSELEAMVSERSRELRAANDELRREIQERIHAEEGLRVSEERFSQAFKASPMALSIQTLRDYRYLDVNECFLALTGLSRQEVIGRSPRELRIWPKHTEELFTQETSAGKCLRNFECQFLTKRGDARQALISTEMLKVGAEPHLLTLAQDITERVQLERQFREAQKMEAIGQLAAGVAHDFNNILTVIQGYASMLQLILGEDGGHIKPVAAILASTERATNLIRQLLMFSRKRVMQFGNVDLNESIRSLSGMLHQLVGEHITIESACAPDLPPIHADRGMVEQVIMNLTVNARDAISKEGRITLSSSLLMVDELAAHSNPDARPGQFVCLTVSDTGSGIAPDLLPHLFEPFFTTKEVGKGTGLGLATVYGIVKQHQGWIAVSSHIGSGTAFRVYLPCSAEALKPALMPQPEGRTSPGSETILVAEDEPSVREMVSDTLKLCGYRVLMARSGPAALEAWRQEKGRIDLLLTDMVMPGGMMGTDLAAELRTSNPNLKVIFSTGYSPGVNESQAPLHEGVNFLPKPYSPQKLAEIVRRCLDNG